MKKLLIVVLALVVSASVFAGGLSGPSGYKPAAVAITGGTIAGVAITGSTINGATTAAVAAVAAGSAYDPASVAITGGTISGISTYVGASICSTGSAACLTTAGMSTGGYSKAASYFLGATKIIFSSTTPTISSGFGTSPSIVSSNGTATFKVNVGTGGAATSGVVAMPAATTGWNCIAQVPTSAAYFGWTMASPSSTTTSVTFENRNSGNGALSPWPASTVFTAICVAY